MSDIKNKEKVGECEFVKNDTKVQVFFPYELHVLNVLGYHSKNKKETVQLYLDTKELRELGEMLIKFADQSLEKENRALEEVGFIWNSAPDFDTILNHLREGLNKDYEYYSRVKDIFIRYLIHQQNISESVKSKYCDELNALTDEISNKRGEEK